MLSSAAQLHCVRPATTLPTTCCVGEAPPTTLMAESRDMVWVLLVEDCVVGKMEYLERCAVLHRDG